jgi:RecD/TraA family predicted helicase
MLTARDPQNNKKLFTGCGEKFVEKLKLEFSNHHSGLFQALEHDSPKLLTSTGKIKPEVAERIQQVWKANTFSNYVALPKQWKITQLDEFDKQIEHKPYETLQNFNKSKDALVKINQFIQARQLDLSLEQQVCLKAKAKLIDSFQVCIPSTELANDFNMDEDDLQDALIKSDSQLHTFTMYNHCYYLSSTFAREKFIAENLAKRLSSNRKGKPFDLSKADLPTLSGEQANAVQLGLASPIHLLTGGPGTGKTYVLGRMLKAWEGAGNKVVVCTPTARGANNLKRVAKANQAMTIHRALGAYELDNDGDDNEPTSGFGIQNVKCDVFVLDEASLVDLEMMYNILKRVPLHAVLVFMGDCDQLPSIRPGCVFRDLLSLPGVNVSRLTEPRRFTSEIDLFAKAIQDGTGMQTLREYRTASFNPKTNCNEIVWIPLPPRVQDPRSLIRQEMDMILRSVNDKNDVQVLLKSNVDEYNQNLFRPLFTGCPPGVPHTHHRVGHRVMHTKNDSGRKVVNGEIGTVVSFDGHQFMQVEFDEGKIVNYSNREEIAELTSAYSMSVHKAQGCEFDHVVLVVHGFPKWTREMFYTACTRAKKRLIVFGADWDVRCAMDEREPHRHSNLNSLVLEELNKMEGQEGNSAARGDFAETCNQYLWGVVNECFSEFPSRVNNATVNACDVDDAGGSQQVAQDAIAANDTKPSRNALLELTTVGTVQPPVATIETIPIAKMEKKQPTPLFSATYQTNVATKTCSCPGFLARRRCVHVDRL